MHHAIIFITAFLGSLTPTDDEAAYTQTINKRADDIVSVLDISDASKSQKVHDILVAQYRALRDWYDANDPKGKAADRDSLKSIHDRFLGKLSEELTPDQIERVKDKMTYNKVKVTYDAYVEIAQTLTSEQKSKVLEFLKEAREAAMDGGSSEEKSAIFKNYKGKINNYLSSQGIDMKQKTKEWGDRQKAKKAEASAATSQPEK